jgi:Uri superfamily endonuclease
MMAGSAKIIMTAATSYQLAIDVELTVRLHVGRFGRFVFAPGRYVYTGSANRNIEARIGRHLRKEKALAPFNWTEIRVG